MSNEYLYLFLWIIGAIVLAIVLFGKFIKKIEQPNEQDETDINGDKWIQEGEKPTISHYQNWYEIEQVPEKKKAG